jgi:hypothetical protein
VSFTWHCHVTCQFGNFRYHVDLVNLDHPVENANQQLIIVCQLRQQFRGLIQLRNIFMRPRCRTLIWKLLLSTSAICPPTTIRAFRRNPSSFTSKIMWHSINWYPIDASLPSGNYLNAIATDAISSATASIQRVLPFARSN